MFSVIQKATSAKAEVSEPEGPMEATSPETDLTDADASFKKNEPQYLFIIILSFGEDARGISKPT
jgi:hypothetical protein